MRNVAAVMVVLGMLSACASVEPVRYQSVALHQELPAIGRAELQDAARIAERWGLLAKLANQSYLTADLSSGRRFDWQIKGVLMRVQRIDGGQPGTPYYIQLNTLSGKLEQLSYMGDQTYKVADWNVVSGDEVMITFVSKQPANRLLLERDGLRHYTPAQIDYRPASAADYAAVIDRHQARVAAAKAQERADKEAFWGNVAAGLAFATQVVAETSADMAASQASTQALQASQASAAAARTAAAAAANSRAQQDAAARQASQLAALNRTMEANRQAAQQNPNAAQAVAASKAASQQIAQAQRAAAAKAEAAEREAQRQTQLAASAHAAAQAQARASSAIRNAALPSSGADSAPARTVMTAAATSGKPVAGQYQIEGGTYMVTLHYDGANLVTTEPNGRVASYDPQNDQSYHYYNPKLDIVFGLRSLGDGVVEAYRPQEPGVRPDRLVLISENTAAPEMDDEQLKLAEKYRALSQSDPANAQSWVACAAVAMKRSVSGGADSERYSRQMAQMLKQIAVDRNRNPCPEVITNW